MPKKRTTATTTGATDTCRMPTDSLVKRVDGLTERDSIISHHVGELESEFARFVIRIEALEKTVEDIAKALLIAVKVYEKNEKEIEQMKREMQKLGAKFRYSTY